MSGRPVKRKGDTNSALVHQLLAVIPSAPSDTAYASSWNGVTTIAPTKNTIWDKLDNIVLPINITAFDGWIEFFGYYYIANADANGRFTAIFICPETRTDYKIAYMFTNDRIQSKSGKLYAGAFGTGEAQNATNIFNALNFDMNTTTALEAVLISSPTFSWTKNEIMRTQWLTDNNDGANLHYVYGVFVWHD